MCSVTDYNVHGIFSCVILNHLIYVILAFSFFFYFFLFRF